ncbi:MAG: FAD-dependent oxidoreductase [bacterium]
MYDLIIIGSGPAGLTAAIYAARYNLKTLVIGQVVGGQVAEVASIENYPGFLSVGGLELSKKWLDQAIGLGVEVVSDLVESASYPLSEKVQTIVKTAGAQEFKTKTLLLASGTEPRKLGVSGEKEFFGKGVTYCFTCDAPFFKGKTVAVVGGGDSAITGALVLADIAEKVFVLHRRDEFTSKPGLLKEARARKNIEFVTKAVIGEIRGVEKVEEVLLEDGRTLKVDGVFVEVGSVPARKLSQMLGINATQTGFVEVGADQSTNMPGIYAAGDITNGSNGVRQIVCAMSEGAVAVQSIFKYLKGSLQTPAY